MKKAALVLKNPKKMVFMKKQLVENGLVYDAKNPDFVVSLGGDGTFLISERKYPGIPKLIIRDSKICYKCVGTDEKTIFQLIKEGKYEIVPEPKIEVKFKGESLFAVNDVILRNKNPNQAIRLRLKGKKEHDEMIGDGIVVSTPFGSTAYYKSITGKTFNSGMSVAFNNPTEKHAPIFFSEKDVLKVKLIRGNAHLAADNNPRMMTVKEGESLTIKRAKQNTLLLITKIK